MAVSALLAGSLAACEPPGTELPAELPPVAHRDPDPETAKGMLRVSVYGARESDDAIQHRTRWRRGTDYSGMEDVDLRGFLDGYFIYGWNQPGQIHVRLGRRPTKPRFGETELYRNVHRWADLALPEGAEVESASLTLQVEDGPDHDVTVLLYALNTPFDPGTGGTRGDNTSPPKPGEVWWRAAAEGERSWGLPGAGFASDSHPEADTPVEALAEAALPEDLDRVQFTGPALAEYVAQQATRGEPLRFLVKLADVDEDTPGTQLYLYSANVGVPHAPSRRPLLEVVWNAPRDAIALERPLHLESGRMLELGRFDLPPGSRTLCASVDPDAGHERPTLLVRGGPRGGEPGDWEPIAAPRTVPDGWDWFELRAVAGHNLVSLGDAFETGFRDTWVRSAPPEEQRVAFWFRSPTGVLHEAEAGYQGDYRWKVSFVPDELGRWHFGYTDLFLDEPFESAPGHFDVVALDRETVRRGLEAFLERVKREHPDASDSDEITFHPAFWRLERAALARETPEHLESEEGQALIELLRQVRVALGGRRVPKRYRTVPMERDF